MKDTVIRLRILREGFGDDFLNLEAPLALILADVCKALGLSEAETGLVLGEEAAETIKEWETARMWEPIEEGHGPVLIEVITSETAAAIAA